jgi:hypothetical protein
MGMDNREFETMKKFLGDVMSDKIPESLDEKMEQAVNRFRRNLPEHPMNQPRYSMRTIWGTNSPFSGWKLAWSTGSLFCIFVAVYLFLFVPSNPSWAEVTKQFKSVPFVHAIVYGKRMVLAEGVQFEIWFGMGGKVRLRYGRQIVFADTNGINKTYDIIMRREVEPNPTSIDIINSLKAAETFSLDTVIQAVTGTLSSIHAVPNRIEETDADLSVFDVNTNNPNESIRVWTLKESLLPIRLHQCNMRDGETIDVFFSYMNPKPEQFFDSEKYRKILNDRTKDSKELIEAY